MSLLDELRPFFYPESVAVVGASQQAMKLGYFCMQNLLDGGFKGRIYPVSRSTLQVLGLPAWPSLASVPGEVDLAMIAIPAEQTLAAVEECRQKRVKGIILIASGFREMDPQGGEEQEKRVCAAARGWGARVLGPNTFGLINPGQKLFASFDNTFLEVKPGRVALLTQSGGMCSFLLHSFAAAGVGISKAMNLGNMCDLDTATVLDYFGQDEDTAVIAIHIEGLDNPRRLLEVAKKISRRKPIVAYKVGKAEGLEQIAYSHAGALVGRGELYRAAFAQAGIVAAADAQEMVDTVKALASQAPPQGDRIGIISIQGGPGFAIADTVSSLGLRLACLSPETCRVINELLPPRTYLNNPIDTSTGAVELAVTRKIVTAVAADPGVDALIVSGTYHATNVALIRAAAEVFLTGKKPVVACFDPPQKDCDLDIGSIMESGLPLYPLPERAARAMAGLVKAGKYLQSAERTNARCSSEPKS